MRDSFFLSREFVGFILIAVVIFISANAFNSHIESQCRASGGTIISRVDDFSMCMHK